MSIVSLKSELADINIPEPVDRNEEKTAPNEVNTAVEPKISDFALRTPTKPYVIDRDSELLKLHNQDNFLDKYYARVSSNSDALGLRKNTRFSFDQPFVIREVDNRLGFDGFEQFSKNNTILRFLDFAGGVVDTVGGAVLGRKPNDFVGSSINSLTRTAKFILTTDGVGFLAKQEFLKRQNQQSARADARYEDASFDGLKPTPIQRTENLRRYNPLSLASLPGVAMTNINLPDVGLVIAPYINTIKDQIGPQIQDLIQDAGKKVIDFGSNLLSPIGNAAAAAGGFIGGGLSNLAKKLPKIPKPNINITIQSPASTSTSTLSNRVATIASRVAEGAKAFAKSSSEVLDKATLSSIIDRKDLQGKGEDFVNLIRYGEENYGQGGVTKSYEQLDFIPFSFYDVVNEKRIVFRALLSGITDTFTPEYASERYVGRPDNVYVYQGTNREISFTFDIYPKSDRELITLWEKMNYLAGLTYPSWKDVGTGGLGMVAPFCKLTIGQMYADTSGYISSLTYTVQDNGTYETTFAKLPKYIQAQCNYTYIGDRLPSSTQKHYEVPWVPEEGYEMNTDDVLSLLGEKNDLFRDADTRRIDPNKLTDSLKSNLIGNS